MTIAKLLGTSSRSLTRAKPEEVVGKVDQPLALGLQALDAFQRAALALRLRILKILRKKTAD